MDNNFGAFGTLAHWLAGEHRRRPDSSAVGDRAGCVCYQSDHGSPNGLIWSGKLR